MTGYVYFFGTGDGKVKIGKANNVESRYRQIKTSCPTGLKILATIKSDEPFTLENKLHAKFQDKRLAGEWFQISEYDVKQTVKEVDMGLGLPAFESLKKAISHFKKITKEMSETPIYVQDADLFFTHADVKFFDKQIKKAKKADRLGYRKDLFALMDALQFNLFMLAQANGSGEVKDVNLQEAARDLLGLTRIICTQMTLRDPYEYLEITEGL